MLTSGQRILTKGRITCPSVIEDWMNPFAACHYWPSNYSFCCIHCSRDSQCFSVGWTTPKIALFRWGIWLLGPMQVSPKHHLDWFIHFSFLQGSQTWQTDMQIILLHLCSNGPHLAVAAMQPNKIGHTYSDWLRLEFGHILSPKFGLNFGF